MASSHFLNAKALLSVSLALFSILGQGESRPHEQRSVEASAGELEKRYTFDSKASDNVAVYFGQTDITGSTSLYAQCEDSNVDIVILAFVTEFSGPGGYPTVNFGAACGGQSSAQVDAGASGLLYCPDLAANITACQALGKPVLLSLGGATGGSTFTDDSQATSFATQLWELFGAGTPSDEGLRPFGDVQVDGFDMDNETNDPTSYGTFATALRSLFSSASKPYYLSAAPQCPRPDASIPEDAMYLCDFVWPQFYNNYCDIGTSYFDSQVSAWAADIADNSTVDGRLYVGVIAWSAGGSGYVDGPDLVTDIAAVKGDPSFGGVMMWDGPEGQANVDSTGENYVEYAKQAVS